MFYAWQLLTLETKTINRTHILCIKKTRHIFYMPHCNENPQVYMAHNKSIKVGLNLYSQW